MMGVLREKTRVRNRKLEVRGHGLVCLIALLFLLMAWGNMDTSLAVQQHQLLTGASHGGSGGTQGQHVVAQGSHETSASAASAPEHATAGQPAPSSLPHEGVQSQPTPGGHEVPPASVQPTHPQPKAPEPTKPGHEGLPGHEGPAEVHAEHGPSLPEISPVAGVTFVETMINLMDHELHERTLGWRPNDIILGRFTDNINNYQLGVLEALRFTTLRLKDSLTRMGDADAYDPDLEQALNLMMNRSTLFWFPSAETAYGEAVEHFKNFVRKLQTGQRSFYYRVDNLRLLISSYKDLLGNVNRSLIRSPVSWFETDDAFYYAKGVAHVYYEILRVVRVGYKSQLASTLNALDIMDEILHELYRAEQIDPWLILDSDLDSFFANHRANLNAPLSEVAHLLGVMGSF